MMRYAQSLTIVLLANQAIAAAAAGEPIILRDPATIFGQKRSGQQATQDARMTLVKPLDRVASAVDGAESSHGKDIAMWRPDLSGPQGPMQVSEAAATDVGGGDRFDLTQNRALGRAYLAQLYGRYKNWPDAIAAYNWGPRNTDTWVKAGRPLEKLLAGVAAYTTRVLHDSGLCDGVQTIPLQRSARFDRDAEFRAAMAGPFARVIFGHFDADGGAFTRGQQYFCGTVPKSFSRVGPLRLKEAGARPRSLFEQITTSARLSWRRATQRYGTQAQGTSSDAYERLDSRAAASNGGRASRGAHGGSNEGFASTCGIPTRRAASPFRTAPARCWRWSRVWRRTTLIVEAHSARPGGRLRTNLCRPPWLLPGYLYEAAAGPESGTIRLLGG